MSDYTESGNDNVDKSSVSSGSFDPSKEIREQIEELFLTTLLKTSYIPRPLPLAIPMDRKKPLHSQEVPFGAARFQSNWVNEGEEPKFETPSHPIEVQIWHSGNLYRYTGKAAYQRITIMAPSIFAKYTKEHDGPIGLYSIDTKLCFYFTSQTWARSFMGATGKQGAPKNFASLVVHDSFSPPKDYLGMIKSKRFFDCIAKIFTITRVYAERQGNQIYYQLGVMLIRSMLDNGICESKTVKFFLNSLNCILKGGKDSPIERWILSFGNEDKAILWRLRKIFTKDDHDPLKVVESAIDRMCIPRSYTSSQIELRELVLQNYESYANAYVSRHFEILKARHDTASLHRASATTFFSRSAGGGGAEVSLIVGMYRLSQGMRSPLCDVFGNLSPAITMQDMMSFISSSGEKRQEIVSACAWFNQELQRRNFSFPYLCIYPERETKARSFMMLPYSLQLGGYMASHTVSHFLSKQSDTHEVFEGFNDNRLLSLMRKDIEAGADTILSLDSAVATDSLPHEVCKRIYKPFYPVFSRYTIDCIERIFSPLRVHAAKTRPKPFMTYIPYMVKISDGIPMYVTSGLTYGMPRKEMTRQGRGFRQAFDRVPSFLRVYPMRFQIAEALSEHRRIILKSPTGSGKTVLAATLFNSIIQFPSVASLQIFSSSLKALSVPHNVYFVDSKDIKEWDSHFNEPHTILCTAFYVKQLSNLYTSMTIVLDEAETRRDQFIYNLFWTKLEERRTLIMSATPEELRNEESTPVLELPGGTNFPVEVRQCNEADLVKLLRDPHRKQTLVCTYSEPSCRKLEQKLKNSGKRVIVLDQRRRQTEYIEELKAANIIIATNIVRSSVTLPDLVEVFDFCLFYEMVDFPLSGFESLVLMRASESMKVQLKGRVGRMQPGVYWEIIRQQRHPENYTTTLLERSELLASQYDTIDHNAYARPINLGSRIIERASQAMIAKFGVSKARDRPLWASIIGELSDSKRHTLLTLVGFEMTGMASRMLSLKEDDGYSSLYDDFMSMGASNYEDMVTTIVKRLSNSEWFCSEINQLVRWAKTITPDEAGQQLYTVANQRAIAVALWRLIGKSDGNYISGRFRDFHIAIPTAFKLDKGAFGIAVGLSLFNKQLTCRAVIPIDTSIVEEIESAFLETEIQVVDNPESIPILGYDRRNTAKGRQDKIVQLSWNSYSTATIFRPEHLDFIWSALENTLNLARAEKDNDKTTCQGSPMSCTASFAVLNGLGLAAHLWVRKETGEALFSASIFGDDDLVVGSKLACRLDEEARESLGLQTKQEATGRITLGENSSDALALFTERLICPKTLRIVKSTKPSGLYRLYCAYHNDISFNEEDIYVNDMDDYRRQLSNSDSRLLSIISEKPQGVLREVARRVTAPRHILTQLLSNSIGPNDKIAIGGDVNRLFNNLESILLLIYPSTKGGPDRVLEPQVRSLSHPLISYSDAVEFANKLQTEDCYFKLKGPPLRFGMGNFAINLAHDELLERGINPFKLSSESEILRVVGWGNPGKSDSTPISPGINLHTLLDTEEPIEYTDLFE